jgi:hypothetical protein
MSYSGTYLGWTRFRAAILRELKRGQFELSLLQKQTAVVGLSAILNVVHEYRIGLDLIYNTVSAAGHHVAIFPVPEIRAII